MQAPILVAPATARPWFLESLPPPTGLFELRERHASRLEHRAAAWAEREYAGRRSGKGPVARAVFKTVVVWQPQAG